MLNFPRLLAILLQLTMAGCAHVEPPETSPPPSGQANGTVEVADTPFFPQEEYQCGPAALATVLTAAGTETSPQALAPEIYLPERKGSLQIELKAATRKRGLIPYQIEPAFEALLEELRSGHPVLVLQNMGFKKYPVWHYAVVFGFDPHKNEVLLRSGTHERLRVTAEKFWSTWENAGHWGLVIVKPGEFPALPDADTYLGEVAALEALGHWRQASLGYSAALDRWPGIELALLGLANAHYGNGDPEAAESAYRRLIVANPGHAIALNNLALLLADRGCPVEARAAIEQALESDAGMGRLEAALLRTRSEIEDKQGGPAHRCNPISERQAFRAAR